jgi:hypothetical protein
MADGGGAPPPLPGAALLTPEQRLVALRARYEESPRPVSRRAIANIQPVALFGNRLPAQNDAARPAADHEFALPLRWNPNMNKSRGYEIACLLMEQGQVFGELPDLMLGHEQIGMGNTCKLMSSVEFMHQGLPAFTIVAILLGPYYPNQKMKFACSLIPALSPQEKQGVCLNFLKNICENADRFGHLEKVLGWSFLYHKKNVGGWYSHMMKKARKYGYWDTERIEQFCDPEHPDYSRDPHLKDRVQGVPFEIGRVLRYLRNDMPEPTDRLKYYMSDAKRDQLKARIIYDAAGNALEPLIL